MKIYATDIDGTVELFTEEEAYADAREYVTYWDEDIDQLNDLDIGEIWEMMIGSAKMDILSKANEDGYDDTLDYLDEHYGSDELIEMLTPEAREELIDKAVDKRINMFYVTREF